jgi:hypothetical protein
MKRALSLAVVCMLVVMLIFAPVGFAQTPTPAAGTAPPLPPTGSTLSGSAILLPAGALVLGSGILTYAILRRR